jgi:heavy metal translocating P-type ATPase
MPPAADREARAGRRPLERRVDPGALHRGHPADPRDVARHGAGTPAPDRRDPPLFAWTQLAATLLGIALGAVASALGAPRVTAGAWCAATAVALVPLAGRVARDLLRRRAGADLVAVLAMAGALALGEYLAGAVIGLMVATGEVLAGYAAARAARELTALVQRAPRTAHRIEASGVVAVAAADVRPGDRLLVREADVVPVDGVAESAATLDESTLTGESRPVRRAPGDAVGSGVVNVGPAFELRATRTAEASTYAGLVRLVRAAREAKAPFVRLADRYALAFIPLTLLVAGAAWAASGDPVRGLAVLVVATPCPLLLAAPVAILGGLSRAARRGIVVKGGGPLEALARADAVFLDKTGTVTSGAPRFHRALTYGAWRDEDALLRLAASLDQVSSHVIAAALVRAARERALALAFPTDVAETPGRGVTGVVEGRVVAAGSPSWLAARLPPDPGWRAFERRALRAGGSTVFVAVDGALAGALVVDDPIRPEAPRTIRALKRLGVRAVTLLTGDHPLVAETVGAALGVDGVLAERTPEEKVQAVRLGRAAGTTVMVGDGINDAPALAAADVGVAMGARGATASSEAADAVLLVDRFDRLPELLRIARRSQAIARQSALGGMALSLVAMGVAAAGLLPPVAGAILQEGIDVLAILNALRALGGGEGGGVRAPLEPARLRAEHRRLAPAIDRLRAVGDLLGEVPPAEARALLLEARRLLGDLLAHERADEREVYPRLASGMKGEDPLGAQSRTHQEIFHLARLFDLLVADLPASGPEPVDLPDLRRILYGLHTVLGLHFAQEEELYQTLPDER